MADENNTGTTGATGGTPPPFEPIILYDADGNAVKAVNVEKVTEITGQIEALKKEVENYKTKDLNFDRFRHKTEAEKQEILAEMSQKERLLYDKIDGLEADREKEKMARMGEAKDAVLDQLAGDNQDLRKAIELQEKEFIGQALSPKEYEERLRKAFTVVQGYKPKVNPLHTPLGSSYREPDVDNKRYTDTPEGRSKFAQLFPDSPQVRQWKKDGKI
jgi:ClpP class serine protease